MNIPGLPDKIGPVPVAALKTGVGLLQRDAQRVYHALHTHDWGAAAEVTLEDIAAILADAGVPYAGLVAKLIPLAIFAVAHPAPVESPAMEKAAGTDNMTGV